MDVLIKKSVCVLLFSVFNILLGGCVCVCEWVHQRVCKVLVPLCSPLSWLWPRQTVVVPGPRLMSGFAALQRTVPPCWCGAAEHHSGPRVLQSYKSPTVRPGRNGTTTAGDGQAHRGRKRCRAGNESVSPERRVHLHLCPHNIPYHVPP